MAGPLVYLVCVIVASHMSYSTPNVEFAVSGETQKNSQSARIRRGLLDGLVGAVLHPLKSSGCSDAHGDTFNLGATLPLGISAGVSSSTADVSARKGCNASAGSSSGGSHGTESLASVGGQYAPAGVAAGSTAHSSSQASSGASAGSSSGGGHRVETITPDGGQHAPAGGSTTHSSSQASSGASAGSSSVGGHSVETITPGGGHHAPAGGPTTHSSSQASSDVSVASITGGIHGTGKHASGGGQHPPSVEVAGSAAHSSSQASSTPPANSRAFAPNNTNKFIKVRRFQSGQSVGEERSLAEGRLDDYTRLLFGGTRSNVDNGGIPGNVSTTRSDSPSYASRAPNGENSLTESNQPPDGQTSVFDGGIGYSPHVSGKPYIQKVPRGRSANGRTHNVGGATLANSFSESRASSSSASSSEGNRGNSYSSSNSSASSSSYSVTT